MYHGKEVTTGMISALLICQAVMDETLPLSNGYLLMSALAKQANVGGDVVFFSPDSFQPCISPILPASFWDMSSIPTGSNVLRFKKGDLCAARVSFFDDEHFSAFSKKIEKSTLSLGGAGFNVLKITEDGACSASRSMPLDVIRMIEGAGGVTFKFFTPTGFKRGSVQCVLPEPSVLFGSLAVKWSKLTGDVVSCLFYENVAVENYNIRSGAFSLKGGMIFRGCLGSVSYSFNLCSEEQRKLLTMLSEFSFYSGVGYKTSQGMGQAFVSFDI